MNKNKENKGCQGRRDYYGDYDCLYYPDIDCEECKYVKHGGRKDPEVIHYVRKDLKEKV